MSAESGAFPPEKSGQQWKMIGSEEEKTPLIGTDPETVCSRRPKTHLTMFFAVACIIDQFGVNPIIVLPRAVILCGWVGYPLAVFVFSLTIYTAMLLGRCWVIAEHLCSDMGLKSRYPYAALAEMAWGRHVAKIINVYINIGIFGSNIPALLLASQNLQFFDVSVSNNTFNLSYCYWLIILGVGLCPLTWLGSPKDSKWISVLSTFLVILTAFITWTCMITDDTKSLLYGEIPQPNWHIIGITFGILAFQFGCHPAILTIQTDMHYKNELSVSVLFSFLATGGLSMITLIMASALYGSGVHANLIQGLPPSITLYVGIMSVTLQLFLSTVVGGCSLFQDLENKFGISPELCWQRCVVRSCVVMLAVTAAEILPRFDLVMGLLGGLFTGPITFIMPPLLYRKFRSMLVEELKAKQAAKSKQSLVSQYFRESLDDKELTEPEQSPQLMPCRYPRLYKCKNVIFQCIKRHLFIPYPDEEDCTIWQSVLLSCVILIGIFATLSATYFSLIGAVERTQHVPPCIVNVDKASNILNK